MARISRKFLLIIVALKLGLANAGVQPFTLACSTEVLYVNVAVASPFLMEWDGRNLAMTTTDITNQLSRSEVEIFSHKDLRPGESDWLTFSFVTGPENPWRNKYLEVVDLNSNAGSWDLTLHFGTVDNDGFLITSFSIKYRDCTLKRP